MDTCTLCTQIQRNTYTYTPTTPLHTRTNRSPHLANSRFPQLCIQYSAVQYSKGWRSSHQARLCAYITANAFTSTCRLSSLISSICLRISWFFLITIKLLPQSIPHLIHLALSCVQFYLSFKLVSCWVHVDNFHMYHWSLSLLLVIIYIFKTCTVLIWLL